MRYRHIHSEFYAGVDVHPKRSQLCVMDKTGRILFNRNLINDFVKFKRLLDPYKNNIVVGCESTYTYYWLADGCMQTFSNAGQL